MARILKKEGVKPRKVKLTTKTILKPIPELRSFAGRQKKCEHFWIIEEPHGPKSWGFCIKCLARKEFLNYIPNKEETKLEEK